MSILPGRSENTVNAVWRLLVRLAVLAAVFYAYYRLRSIVVTLFVAAIIAYVLDPIVEWMTRRPGFVRFHTDLAVSWARCKAAYERVFLRRAATGEPRIRLRRHALRLFAALYTFILAVFVLWYGTKTVVTPFVQEFRAATSPEGRRQARENKEKFLAWYNTNVPDWARSDQVERQFQNSDGAKSLQKFAAEIGARILDNLRYVVELVLLPVLAFYFLIDGRQLKHEFVSLVPRSRLRETLRILHEFNAIMRAFIGGQFILCILAGFVVGVGLAALHVRYPMILGVLAGITRAIPIIGPIIGGIPIIVLTLVTKGVPVALAVLGFFTFLHFAESKFIMPWLIGDRMELHPVIIIVVLIVGGELGGIVIGGQIGALLGMFFAAPLASIARVLIRRYWLHLRSGSRPGTSLPPAAEPVRALPASLPEAVD